MPNRPFVRAQAWLMPPSLELFVPDDHPARFVADLVDGLTRQEWLAMGIDPDGSARGAAGYAPRALLGAWLYGLMTGVRTTRRLEQVCAEHLPLLWLTGGQRPDHNTLWRFYAAHRVGLGQLFTRSVRTAVGLDLVDLAVQAVDGTKLRGSVARADLRSEAGLEQLLAATQEVLAQVDDQQAGDGGGEPPRLPPELQDATDRQAKIRAALDQVQREDGPDRASPTDPEARVQKLRGGGYAVGYNGQAAAAGLQPEHTEGVTGQLLTAVDLTNQPHDHELLPGMVDAVEQTTGAAATTMLADTGYFSSSTLEALETAHPEVAVLVPDGQAARPDQPYHKDRFTYDPTTDTVTCPKGQTLPFAGLIRRPDGEPTARRYRAARSVCAACPVLAQCTRSAAKGRSVSLRPDDARLKAHRWRMAAEAAQAVYRRRKTLIEPVFGILKECQDGRRLYLRGLAKVRAEWTLLATAFNYRVLAKIWQRAAAERRIQLVGAAA
jgi:transposase